MSHPYGRKTEVVMNKRANGDAEVTVNETTTNELHRGGRPIQVLYFKGRPVRMSEMIVKMLMEREYCMPLDLIGWAMTFKRSENETVDGRKIVLTIEQANGVKQNG